MDEQREKTLHVSFGIQCNNNCIMCMEPRFCAVTYDKSVEEHKKFIKNSFPKGFSRIVFTQKEPTLSFHKLIPLIKYAREIGYKDVMLITNARLLSYRSIVIRLLRAGLNHIEMSLHGPNKKTHESITRTPGSFNQTLKGIMNVYELSRKFDINFSINFTITLFNYKTIKDFYKLASSFKPDNIIFNFFTSKERAYDKAHLLTPKYSNVIEELRKIKSHPFFIIDFPPCVVPNGLFDKLGQIEDYHLLDESSEKQFIRDDWVDSKENLGVCQECKYNRICPKPSKEYLKKYGNDEFYPLK